MNHELKIFAAASKCLFVFLVSKPMLSFPKHPEKKISPVLIGHLQ